MANPQRELLFARSNGICQCTGACALHAGRCATAITLETFHRSHLRSRKHGGSDHETNLEAWCSRCNLTLQSRDASDPRVLPREWQMRELDNIVGSIVRTGAATLSAAPGAGKTIFTALVFEALQDAGIAARLMVVVPRRGLADQWTEALAQSRHLQLKPHSALERPGQHGEDAEAAATTLEWQLSEATKEIERLKVSLPQPTENLSLWQVRYLEARARGEFP